MDVAQIFCRPHEDSDDAAYDLCLKTKSGEVVELQSEIFEQKTAFFYEQEIERFLKIEDVAVDGDYIG